MLNIGVLKARGKEAMKANYWMSVVVAMILGGVAAGAGSGTGSSASNAFKDGELLKDPDFIKIFLAVLAVAAVLAVVFILLDIFVFNPLEAGCLNFFRENNETKNGQFGALGAGFKPSWLNNVKTLFLRDIFLFLWGLLFIIPGIVKSYSYRMVPYIITDHPEISGTEAITLSRKMMKGHKMEAFFFDLSFLGWILLGCITCGILLVFYVNPYYYNASAGIYNTLKADYPELNDRL